MDKDDIETLQRRRRALGDRLRILRLHRNLTQDGLVARSGVGRNTIQRAEAGVTAIRIDHLWALADALGVPVTSLLSDDWHSPEWGHGGGANPGEPPDTSATPRHR